MRILIFVLMTLGLIACNESGEKTEIVATDTAINKIDTNQNTKPIDTLQSTANKYENERFKDVHVEKLSDTKFQVRGQGQIFEASFGWTVEDGHNELKNGFANTDAGAPSWGSFDFTIDVAKERENSTLTLLIYELSAKDGSRQYVLIMPLK